MNEVPKEDSTQKSDLEIREERLRQSLGEFERDLSLRKAKTKKSKEQWTRREGIYMVLFQAIVIFCVGGIHGSNLSEVTPSMRRSALFDAEGALSFSFNGFFSGVGDMLRGYPRHFAEAWYADLPLMLLVILIAFKVKDTRLRRRYFSMAETITIAVLAGYLASTIPGVGSLSG